MAMTSPAVSLAIEAMWGNIKPTLAALKKLGQTDFSAEAPSVNIKPGQTIKIPISSVSKASEYNATSNHYRTGGETTWAELVAKHYLQGFDLTGVNIDQGVDASRVKQLFTSRAGTGVAMAALDATRAALDGCTVSTAVTLAASPDLEAYLGLGCGQSWLDRAGATLAVSGTELAKIKGAFAAAHVMGTETELAQFMGFKDLVHVPGLTARLAIVPAGSLGYIARVPAILARYMEAGVETDPDTGLSVGIVVADDQDHNRLIANADLWFGCAVQTSAAGATTPGIIKVGTAA